MSDNNEPLRVIIDTNVVVSGLINLFGAPHQLAVAWQSNMFVLLTTDAIRDEYALVLARPRFARKYGLSPAFVTAFLRRLDLQSTHVHPVETLPITVRDSNDNHILAAALGGDPTHIVTGDDDLLVLNGDPRLGNLRIVIVRGFLELLGETQR